MNKIALTADVKKMYFQVKVAEDQWDLQRIFWRKEGGEIEEYWLTRVTFGMASAPHCAVRAMQQCAIDQQIKYPKAAAVVLNDFFMDDGLFGCDTIKEALQLITDLDNLMKNGGFDLRKWQCNNSEVLRSIEQEKDFSLGEENGSVLGLRWLSSSDELSFLWKGQNEEVDPTKKGFASDLAKFFYPFGAAGPVLVAGKIMIRELHLLKYDWSKKLPDEIVDKWVKWREGLKD